MINRFIILLFITNGLQVFATDGKNLATILNFHRIAETIGTAGQPTRTQFEDVKNADFAVVVNLAMPDSPNALADEADTLAL